MKVVQWSNVILVSMLELRDTVFFKSPPITELWVIVFFKITTNQRVVSHCILQITTNQNSASRSYLKLRRHWDGPTNFNISLTLNPWGTVVCLSIPPAMVVAVAAPPSVGDVDAWPGGREWSVVRELRRIRFSFPAPFCEKNWFNLDYKGQRNRPIPLGRDNQHKLVLTLYWLAGNM